jgi:hypothetical protein
MKPMLQNCFNQAMPLKSFLVITYHLHTPQEEYGRLKYVSEILNDLSDIFRDQTPILSQRIFQIMPSMIA